MIFKTALPFIEEFIDRISQELKTLKADYELSRFHKAWISFCMMGVIVTGTLCWSHFEKFGLGKYTMAASSWMLRKAKIAGNFF